MSQKTIILTILFFIGVSISCYKDGCPGGPYPPSYFNIIGMEASFNSTQFNKLSEYDTVTHDRVKVYFDFQMEYYSHVNDKTWNFSFGKTAYACTPPIGGSDGSKTERFEEIIIITLNDYNDSFKALDTINQIVDLSLGGNENPSPFYFSNYLDLHSFGPYPLLQGPSFNASENQKPFQIILIIKLSTGEKYEAISPLVYIRRY